IQMVEQNLWLGGVSTVISVVAFGTVFVPIKKFEARDGTFVALMMGVGMLIPCLVSSLAYSTPTVFPLALISGLCYAIANSCSIFIMEQVGMAVGGLVWNVVTALSGWAVARWVVEFLIRVTPLFVHKCVISRCGVLQDGLIFTFVRSNPIPTRPAPGFEAKHINNRPEGIGMPLSPAAKRERPPIKMRLIGFVLALLCGLLHGNTPTPINYLRLQHAQGAQGLSPHNGAYMLSFAIGSILTSLSIFTISSLLRHNRPFINVEIAIPSILGGILYGIAISFLFVSIENLDQAIGFPICSIAPGIVNTLWAIFFYKEIHGKANLSILGLAYIVTIAGIVIIALSKNTAT
ncbi:hypothetical protein PMAYCL1PPCAC_10685, partial [Pristionchus mayeri]